MVILTLFSKTKKYQLAILIIGIILLVFLSWVVGSIIPEQIDWIRTYRPAIRELLAFRSPYRIKSFFNPPWILIPMIPFALLPDKIGNGLLFIVSFCVIIYSAVRMGAKPLSLIFFLFSFPVVFLLIFGQIEWMILLGFTLPPQLGLLLVLSKPQISIPYALFWLIESWRIGGIKQVLRVFFPVFSLFILSILFFGLWFRNIDSNIIHAIYNFSLWPYGLLIGFPLLVYGLFRHKEKFSVFGGPFFSPYVAVHSWATSLLAILSFHWASIVASVVSWIMYFIRIH